jgi:hypothetical protein
MNHDNNPFRAGLKDEPARTPPPPPRPLPPPRPRPILPGQKAYYITGLLSWFFAIFGMALAAGMGIDPLFLSIISMALGVVSMCLPGDIRLGMAGFVIAAVVFCNSPTVRFHIALERMRYDYNHRP